MKAAVLHGAHDLRVEEVADPECGEDDIVVHVRACGICGTDLHAVEDGLASPQVLGHEFSGEVVEVGSAVREIRLGDRVTAWPIADCEECPRCREGNPNLCESAFARGVPGAFAEYVRIPRARLDRTVYRLPDSIDWIQGATVEPLSVGLHAVSVIEPSRSDTVVVFGLGTIGLCTVQALRQSGVRAIIGVDVSARRRAAAVELGADSVVDPLAGDAVSEIRSSSGVASGVDVVCECSGAASALVAGLEVVRPAGKFLFVAMYGKAAAVSLNFSVFARKELNVRGAFCYQRRDFQSAIDLLSAEPLRAESLITHVIPLAEIAKAFATQFDRQNSIKVIVDPLPGSPLTAAWSTEASRHSQSAQHSGGGGR